MKYALCVLAVFAFAVGAAGDAIDGALREITDGLTAEANRFKVSAIGVFEFSNLSPLKDADNRLPGRYFSELAAEYFVNASGRRFDVIDRQNLGALISESSLDSSGLLDRKGRGDALGRIGTVDCLVVGVLIRKDRTLWIKLTLIRIPDGRHLASRSSYVQLDPMKMAIFGVHVPNAAPDTRVALRPDAPIPNAVRGTEGYTGLIVDARSQTLSREKLVRIRRADGTELKWNILRSAEYMDEYGIASYAASMEKAAQNTRIGSRPLTVTAVGRSVRGKCSFDPMISNDDAARILSENAKSGFLDFLNIVIVVDPKRK